MTVSPLRSALRARLTIAMRERDHHAVSAIRSALAAVENAEAVPTDGSLAATSSGRVAGAVLGVGAAEARRRELSAADEVALVRAEVADFVTPPGTAAASATPMPPTGGRRRRASSRASSGMWTSRWHDSTAMTSSTGPVDNLCTSGWSTVENSQPPVDDTPTACELRGSVDFLCRNPLRHR